MTIFDQYTAVYSQSHYSVGAFYLPSLSNKLTLDVCSTAVPVVSDRTGAGCCVKSELLRHAAYI